MTRPPWKPTDDTTREGVEQMIARIHNATADLGVRLSAEATLRALMAERDRMHEALRKISVGFPEYMRIADEALRGDDVV